ncbi:FAD-dependent oxidoreductase [Paenibacillus sp.]|uniref:FAD-dependent oxidoreductase n=1 Tax=Paenibacillus sp. TaxID=58172 RepID=UPI002D31EE32|nr:FAD-dependent oxidoreductase [Paenibacillus sp.]HZG55522.1 FAD-dependent oxidoreductase [Paenibacillus sp.]
MYDIAIIGAGPAGASAAIFTAKAGKSTVVIDSDKGVTRRAWFENFYGIMEIDGPTLVDIGIAQLKKLGAEYILDEATDIAAVEGGFSIATAGGASFQAKHVVLATGLSVELGEKLGAKTAPGTEPRIKSIFEVDAAGRTNVPGVWAAGTVAGVSMHGVITAGDGAKVAINLISELNGERYVDHDVIKPKA